MKQQRDVILLFSKFCLENAMLCLESSLEYRVFFANGFICLENKIFLLQVDKTGLATIYIHRTGEILECKHHIDTVFAKIYEQLV